MLHLAFFHLFIFDIVDFLVGTGDCIGVFRAL